jgi:hypothetical protein
MYLQPKCKHFFPEMKGKAKHIVSFGQGHSQS